MNAKAVYTAIAEIEDIDDRATRRLALHRIETQFQNSLAARYLPNIPNIIREKTFTTACELGHASGYSEVEMYYEELAKLVRFVIDNAREDN